MQRIIYLYLLKLQTHFLYLDNKKSFILIVISKIIIRRHVLKEKTKNARSNIEYVLFFNNSLHLSFNFSLKFRS